MCIVARRSTHFGVVLGAVVAKQLEVGLVDGQQVVQSGGVELSEIPAEEDLS